MHSIVWINCCIGLWCGENFWKEINEYRQWNSTWYRTLSSCIFRFLENISRMFCYRGKFVKAKEYLEKVLAIRKDIACTIPNSTWAVIEKSYGKCNCLMSIKTVHGRRSILLDFDGVSFVNKTHPPAAFPNGYHLLAVDLMTNYWV